MEKRLGLKTTKKPLTFRKGKSIMFHRGKPTKTYLEQKKRLESCLSNKENTSE